MLRADDRLVEDVVDVLRARREGRAAVRFGVTHLRATPSRRRFDDLPLAPEGEDVASPLQPVEPRRRFADYPAEAADCGYFETAVIREY